MSDYETVYGSKLKHTGNFDFKEFYRWCYDFLSEETSLKVTENRYIEKVLADAKSVDIFWTGTRKITSYFLFEVKIQWRILGLKDVEIQKDGQKIKVQNASVEIKVKGTLKRDYEDQFEAKSWTKSLMEIYDKYFVPARIDEYETKLISDCNEFLDQAKAYLELLGNKGDIIQI